MDSWVFAEELIDDGVVVETTLDFALDEGVFDLFVLLDDVLNLRDDALEGPFGQVGGHLHIFLLSGQLYLLHLLHEVTHLQHARATATESV